MAAIFQTFSDAFSWIKMYEFFIKISLKFVPKGPVNNVPVLVQIMAWCWPVDKPLSEPMMVSLLMHISVTWPQWVNLLWPGDTIDQSQHWLRQWLVAWQHQDINMDFLCHLISTMQFIQQLISCTIAQNFSLIYHQFNQILLMHNLLVYDAKYINRQNISHLHIFVLKLCLDLVTLESLCHMYRFSTKHSLRSLDFCLPNWAS